MIQVVRVVIDIQVRDLIFKTHKNTSNKGSNWSSSKILDIQDPQEDDSEGIYVCSNPHYDATCCNPHYDTTCEENPEVVQGQHLLDRFLFTPRNYLSHNLFTGLKDKGKGIEQGNYSR
jgi:hypothetical protein